MTYTVFPIPVEAYTSEDLRKTYELKRTIVARCIGCERELGTGHGIGCGYTWDQHPTLDAEFEIIE